MQENTDRNYSSISPSAYALLRMKGLSNIPYAREAAALLPPPGNDEPYTEEQDLLFWARVMHFENRYWSVNRLLEDLDIPNILELSSGFSFRGLVTVREKPVHYIDTDLPEMIVTKQRFVQALQKGAPKGTLELMPLNALDEAGFQSVAARFPEGPLVIVNEGLMMYLDDAEKKKLLAIIRKVLAQRGGYWITADIYLRNVSRALGVIRNDKLQQFFEQHRIEDHMFESLDAARAFFEGEGFVVDKVSPEDYSRLSTLKKVQELATAEQLDSLSQNKPIQETWRLRIA